MYHYAISLLKRALLLCLAALPLWSTPAASPTLGRLESAYPHFDNNSALSGGMRAKIKPYLLPQNHAIKSALDALFGRERVTKDAASLARAGFITISERPYSYAIIAKHPSFPGYIFKLYLDTEKRKKNNIAGWEWLVKRCQGAENVRRLIRDKGLRHFSVPDKWLYPLPYRSGVSRDAQPIILIATDMDLAPRSLCEAAWKKASREVIDELFCIISHGFSSCYLVDNIPLTNNGKFSCIDTEHPKREPSYDRVKRFLSDRMKVYWDSLVKGQKRRQGQ